MNIKSIEGADLKSRWEAALKDARSSQPNSRVWISYSFKVRHGVGVEIVVEPGYENQNLGLFFLYDPATNSVRKFDVYNLDRQQEFDYPAYWLGHAETDASVNLLRVMVVAKSGDPMSPHLIEAIAMHDTERADVALKELAQQFPKTVEGTMSTYWLRERLAARQPFNELPDNVAALSEILRNDQESLAKRRKAALALGLCADPAGLIALASFYPLAQDRNVKSLILGGALHKVNRTSVKLFLEVAATETDRHLKRQAYDWLAEKTGRRIAWDLKPGIELFPNEEVSEEENAELRKMSRGAPDDAARMLIEIAETHANIGVRKAAVERLGKLWGERALEFFRKVLSQDAKAVPASAAVIRF